MPKPPARPGRAMRSVSRSVDAEEPSMMEPPPTPPHLRRPSADVHRRPSRRDPSPRQIPREAREHCRYAEDPSASGVASDEEEGDFIEVIEELDEPRTPRARRQPGGDDYPGPQSRRRHRSQRGTELPSDDDDSLPRRSRRQGTTDRSTARDSADKSGSSRHGRRRKPDGTEDSRPPVSGGRLMTTPRHAPADNMQQHDHLPQRRGTVRSSRSRAGSVSTAGQTGRAPPDRLASSEKRAKERKPARRVECATCVGDVSASHAEILACGHAMCHACLEHIFRRSVADPQHMPPMCCTMDPIPLQLVDGLFDERWMRRWKRKFAEHSTQNRLRCPSRTCRQWFEPTNIGKGNDRWVTRCSHCGTKVCVLCSGWWHGSEECPVWEETARVLARTDEDCRERCYRCKAMVELQEDGDYVTCRCGAELCGICGAKWTSCDCRRSPSFDDGGYASDSLGRSNVPRPTVRRGGGDAYESEISATVRRGHDPVTMAVRRRPRWDAKPGRRARYSDDHDDEHDVMDAAGDMGGMGSASSHGIRGEYRRPSAREMGASFAADVGRDRGRDRGRDDSLERRLAYRLSETRAGAGLRQMAGPMSPPMSPPIRPPPTGPTRKGRRPRQHSLEEELYNSPSYATRLERIVTGCVPHSYDDEVEIRPPRGPRPSDMAGLTLPGAQGMNRVSQWRSFVEPGLPEREPVA
ncbi:hypothetical protein RJ55_08227 [Drechmeria coniospora]|nr:hypothetical protein RJ55_08227 [Drechmeria coniospora]